MFFTVLRFRDCGDVGARIIDSFSESKNDDGAVKRCGGRRGCDFIFECFNSTFYPKKKKKMIPE